MIPKQPGRRQKEWRIVDQRRLSPAERRYDYQWQERSKDYRRRHPLCVQCLLLRPDQPQPSRCVDHIVPAHSCPDLFWEVTNWAALCLPCHGYKTRNEPQHAWQPISDRLVVCGLPGVGKTTYAKSTGLPYWDADERPELQTPEAIVAARDAWLETETGSLVIVVASIVTASQLAARVCGSVVHLTERFIDRAPRAARA